MNKVGVYLCFSDSRKLSTHSFEFRARHRFLMVIYSHSRGRGGGGGTTSIPRVRIFLIQMHVVQDR